MRNHSHYCIHCKRDRACQNPACLVATVATCQNCERFLAGAPVKTLVLTVQTFWRSCPDATHFYGTIRQNGKVVKEITRQQSRIMVERYAESWLQGRMYRKNAKAHYRLIIKLETQHL